MTNRDRESILLNDLPNARLQVQVYEAVTVVANDAHAVLDIILSASGPEAARAELQDRYGFTEVQSQAVMDLQFRRMTARDREEHEEHLREVTAQVEALEQQIGD